MTCVSAHVGLRTAGLTSHFFNTSSISVKMWLLTLWQFKF